MKRDFVVIDDFSNVEIMDILRTTFEIKNRNVPGFDFQGKRMLNLFFEPSTRTRLSFEMAMLQLGGEVSNVTGIESTSLSKGESLADMARVVSGYGYDFIVVRHPLEGAPQVVADNAWVPVINAGDGSHQHPTQTLVDLCTIRDCKGHLNNLRVGLAGDLCYGRTVHSLAIALARFGAETIFCIGPPELKMPEWVLEQLARLQTSVIQLESIEAVIDRLDVLYLTRVQKERLAATIDYEALQRAYSLNKEMLKKAKGDLLILHPLPRTDELPREVDNDPRAKYFPQSDNGVPVRMALISMLLGKMEQGQGRQQKTVIGDERCLNPRCVTLHEPYVKPEFNCLPNNLLSCFYCGHLLH